MCTSVHDGAAKQHYATPRDKDMQTCVFDAIIVIIIIYFGDYYLNIDMDT